MKIFVECNVRLRKTIDVDVDPEKMRKWLAGETNLAGFDQQEGWLSPEESDAIGDKVSEALPSFGEWDDSDVDDEHYEEVTNRG